MSLPSRWAISLKYSLALCPWTIPSITLDTEWKGKPLLKFIFGMYSSIMASWAPNIAATSYPTRYLYLSESSKNRLQKIAIVGFMAIHRKKRTMKRV
ncbi:hypothetical protein TL16_g01800 [Triparma laevis f. inornata]|uniref:Uncharacterized protein n=1 Tax=Triparma laevis f. inornata TaxID=1714386 RepID=A0A9W6ZLD9_9STRA|nr:hypothetical protein TL16_g01800 [Triparma laevis f. inornata]